MGALYSLSCIWRIGAFEPVGSADITAAPAAGRRVVSLMSRDNHAYTTDSIASPRCQTAWETDQSLPQTPLVQ